MTIYGFKSAAAICLALTLSCAPPPPKTRSSETKPSHETQAPVKVNDDLQLGLQGLVDKYGQERGFSGTVLIARGDNILVEQSYGMADIAWDVPNQPEAKYRIGSLTKPLLATLVMKLTEVGLLSLDGTLGDYLPDIYGQTAAAPVTIAQLLSHTSGLKDIPNHFDDPWYHTIARQSFAPKDFAAEWIKPVMMEEPGTTWRYNNAGFILLGLVIEEVTGAPYGKSLKRYVFDPAGMSDSGVFSEDMVLPKLAQAYAPQKSGVQDDWGQEGGKWAPPLRVDASVFFSAAGIYSTARDLYRFDRALYTSEIISSETRQNMMEKKTNFPYGFGWGTEVWTMPDESRLSVKSHTGSIPGYQSYYLRSEGNQGSVIILNNTNNGAVVRKMGRDLMEVLNGKPIRLDLSELLWPIAQSEGDEAMIAAYQALGDKRYDYELSSRAMNRFGYRLWRADHKAAAVAIFEWGTAENPRSANIHDSLGETYRKLGRTADAVKAYERAIDLNPEMESSLKALKEIHKTGH